MHLLTLLAVYSTEYTAYQSSVLSLLSYPLLLLIQELELELNSIVTISQGILLSVFNSTIPLRSIRQLESG